MKKKKVYFAHPISTYNTILEEYFLEYFASDDSIEILNPNTPEHQKNCAIKGMDYFKDLVQSCDCLYSYSFGDKTIGAGIAKEMDWMKEKGGKVLFFSLFDKFEKMTTKTSAEQFKVLSVEETRIKLKSYKHGTYKKQNNSPVKISSVSTFGSGFVIEWSKEGVGFGQLSLRLGANGYELDSECMGESFCNEVLAAFVKKYLKVK